MVIFHSQVHLQFLSGTGARFELYIVSEKFEGLALLDRQRMVHELLKEELKGIHAISMKTWTSSEWDKKKSLLPKEVLDQIH